MAFDWTKIEGFGPTHWAQGFYEKAVEMAPCGAMMVELGTFSGRGLCHLGITAKAANKGLSVVGIDCVDHGIAELLKAAGIDDMTRFIHEASPGAARHFDDNSVWWIYIDGAHYPHELVEADVRAWMPKLTPDGYFTWDDYQWYSVAEPINALLDGVKFHPPHMGSCRKQLVKDGVDIHATTVVPDPSPWPPS